tara:strand:- start:39 stop:347 length:309 start_codon:yes stop_codon:yes gene_type:complete
MELEKVHLLRILQMPGGTSEILLRGEKNGTDTRLYYTEGLVCVKRNVQGVDHMRLVPLNNVQSMEEYGGQQAEKGTQGSSKRSAVESGKKAAGRGSSKKKKG